MEKSIDELESEIKSRQELLGDNQELHASQDGEIDLEVALNVLEKQLDFQGNMQSQFDQYVNSGDKDVQKGYRKHNKKTFKLFKKRKENLDNDITAVETYRARYNRETWFYKRHKDTIDKYIKKDEKDKQKENQELFTIKDEEPLRIGFVKMLSIVWFDLLMTYIGYIVLSPIYLFRGLVELFYKMKKSVAVATIIITVIIVLAVGLIFGIGALLRYARGV